MELLTFRTIVSVVYPIIASYNALESYSNVANKLDSNLKVGGYTIPIGMLFNSHDLVNDQMLQFYLVAMQKWFIYWIIFASLQLIESILFLKYIIPFYFFWKFMFNIWLVLPFIKFNPLGEKFDQAQAWLEFNQSGSGFIYFNYLQPGFHDLLAQLQAFNLPVTMLNSYWKQPIAASTVLDVPESMLENSYVVVKSLRNRFYGDDSEVQNKEINEPVKDVPIAISTSIESKNSVPDSPPIKSKRKSWFW